MNHSNPARSFGACVLLVCQASAPAAPDTAADIVARVRNSLGLANFRALDTVRLSGTAVFLGNASTAEVFLDHSGRSRLAITGPISIIWASDGTSAWTTDLAGETRRESLGDREQVVLGALILSGLAFAENSNVRFTLDEPRCTDAASIFTFTHDQGRASGDVEISRDSWRPVKWTINTSQSTDTWELAGGLDAGGVHFPARATQTSNHGTRTHFTLAAAVPIAPDPARFAMPSVTYTDVHFDPTAPAALEIKKAPTGHLLVKATLDGQHEGWFIFDTGAGINCLASTAIDEHKYERIAEVPAMGIGGTVGAPMVRPKSLRIGPVTLDAPLCIGLDLADISGYMGEDLKGIIGYNLFARVIAEIDMTTPAVRLHDPAHYALERGEWSPLTLAQRAPALAGSIEGHEGFFKIDTGAANSTLSVHAPAVERLKLLEGRETEPDTLGGVGGFVQARSGVVTLFELAGTRKENITVNFATERKGAFADPYSLGNVGGKLLAPYTLIVDYQNNRAALVAKE